jgi:pyridinium-3,5-biscarboxylic acid mononucleotide synthase
LADLSEILEDFANGKLALDQARQKISLYAIEGIEEMAKLDVGRQARRGMPEVIFSQNKVYSDLVKIAVRTVQRNGQAVLTRVRDAELGKVVRALNKKGIATEVGTNSTTLVARSKNFKYKMDGSRIGIMAAGTSDIGVAEEARLTAKAMGCDSIVSYDVGIAGMHRVFPPLREMVSKDVGAIVVVAGMEGALASVVASMSSVPVIGVPTSVGYGFGSNGIAALASMLQSCTLGLATVNIDNGVGAGAFAASIAKRAKR